MLFSSLELVVMLHFGLYCIQNQTHSNRMLCSVTYYLAAGLCQMVLITHTSTMTNDNACTFSRGLWYCCSETRPPKAGLRTPISVIFTIKLAHQNAYRCAQQILCCGFVAHLSHHTNANMHLCVYLVSLHLPIRIYRI